jgi:phosphate-selective porin
MGGWFRSLATAAALVGVVVGEAGAQRDEPAFEELSRLVKRDYLSLGVLFQAVADLQAERSMPGNSGFSVANFRVALSGELDQRFGYFLQTNFTATPAILDARMYYRPTGAVRVDVGRFKAPFSHEFLTPASSIDFVNRAQAVTALVPGRQIGMQLGVGPTDGPIALRAGIFNGNSASANGNDGGDFLYTGRVSGSATIGPEGASHPVVYGVSVARSVDQAASFGQGFVTSFSGDRTVFGADVRATVGGTLAAAEIAYAELDPVIGLNRRPWGGHVTLGHMVRANTQVLARLDFFDSDTVAGRSDWLVLGLNMWPTAVTEFQVNYVVDVDQADIDNHQVLVNFQFGF